MTSLPNPTAPADGGRVWQPTKTVSTKSHNSFDGTLKAFIVIPLIVLFMVLMGNILSNTMQAKVTEVTETLSNGLTINELTPAQEQIKPWVPTALGLDEAKVSKVLLPTIEDGATGTVLLTNGDTVPFTLHLNKNTLTVDEG